MTAPDAHAEQRARNAALRDELETSVAELTRRREALAEAQGVAAEVVGRATSDDGLVTITVNALGVVVGAQLQDVRRVGPDQLAKAFVTAAQAAAGQARAMVEQAMAPVTAEVPDLEDIFPGMASFADLLAPPPRTERNDRGGSILRPVSS